MRKLVPARLGIVIPVVSVQHLTVPIQMLTVDLIHPLSIYHPGNKVAGHRVVGLDMIKQLIVLTCFPIHLIKRFYGSLPALLSQHWAEPCLVPWRRFVSVQGILKKSLS